MMFFVFVFFKMKTAYEMRISDWSSDVCSSDLIITIQLVERTIASKSSASGTNRDSSFGLSPPTTGPLSLFLPSDIGMGGGSDFKGKGEASQSNRLAGEISVTIAEVYPNGTMLVRGEKLLTLNRGDERVQISGLIRAIDIAPDNRIASRSEEHTSELQSLMRISYAVFCLIKQ